MFSVANVKPRYFEFQQPGGDNVLKIEPPKLKTLRELEEVGNDDRKLILSPLSWIGCAQKGKLTQTKHPLLP